MMALQSISRKSIVVVVLLIIMFEPTTTGLGDFFKKLGNEHTGECEYTSCDRHPRCKSGYDSLMKSEDDCLLLRQRSYCCKRGKGPQCFATGCGKKTSCPRYYYAIDRTKNGCTGSEDNSYCCKSTDLPFCFDLSCPAVSEPVKYCPLEYKETRRAYGQLGGCVSDLVQRVTCCFPVDISTTTANQNVNGNQGFSSNAGFKQNVTVEAVYSKNRTIKWEDGRIQIVVKPRQYSNESLFDILFGNSNSSFSSFSQLSLLLPILIVLSAFNKLI